MSYSQADADRLRRAIASGVLRSRVRGEETEFRTLDDMRETLRMIERELGVSRARLPYRTVASTPRRQ